MRWGGSAGLRLSSPASVANGGGRCRNEMSAKPTRVAADGGDLTFNSQRDAHAAADTQRGQALLGIALAHFVQQGGENARARCPDGMADGDGAAIDVHFGRIPAHILVDGT